MSSQNGSSEVDATALGFGVSATLYGDNGFYFDGQLSFENSSVDFTSSAGGKMAESIDASTFAVSAEIGQRFDQFENWSLVPQAQLMWSNTEIEDFTDNLGNDVSFQGGDSQIARLGVAFEYIADENKPNARAGNYQNKLYGIVNVLHDFAAEYETDISGVSLDGGRQKTWLEAGLGGTYQIDEKSSVYGEILL
ncbi:MAG: autotransporter outer membrane beta-barrel domain-containing protein [Pseudomonadota bacterium]